MRRVSDNEARNRDVRVLIYSHDTFGLGHLRRCLTIAHSLVDQNKDMSVIILTGSPIIGSFNFRARVDFVRIPGVIKLRSGDYTPLSLLIDIDDLSTINDSLGIDAGDQVLGVLAQRLQACVAKGDTLARLGGDEFVVVMEHADSSAMNATKPKRIFGQIDRFFFVASGAAAGSPVVFSWIVAVDMLQPREGKNLESPSLILMASHCEKNSYACGTT